MSASTATVVDEFTLEVHARPATAQQRDQDADRGRAGLGDPADELLPDPEFAAVPDVDWDAAPHGEPDLALDLPDPTP
jgi:hypothetical protein